jgi:hypothetical protein
MAKDLSLVKVIQELGLMLVQELAEDWKMVKVFSNMFG